jgi:hypothetical protein
MSALLAEQRPDESMLGAVLAGLLHIRIIAEPGWRFRWIDSIVHLVIARPNGRGPGTVDGVAIWGDGRYQFCDPFRAELWTQTDSHALRLYRLYFGDLRMPCGSYGPGQWFGHRVREWRYTFRQSCGPHPGARDML